LATIRTPGQRQLKFPLDDNHERPSKIALPTRERWSPTLK
jgi:hypothetical protein